MVGGWSQRDPPPPRAPAALHAGLFHRLSVSVGMIMSSKVPLHGQPDINSRSRTRRGLKTKKVGVGSARGSVVVGVLCLRCAVPACFVNAALIHVYLWPYEPLSLRFTDSMQIPSGRQQWKANQSRGMYLPLWLLMTLIPDSGQSQGGHRTRRNY